MAKAPIPRIKGMGANLHNPKAASLAKAINGGGDVQELVRSAIVDAQLHDDWKGVVAIENSLDNVDNRTKARHTGYVGTRALIVNRLDTNAYARRIPEGFDSGLAWLVCFVFLRTDGDVETGLDIAQRFHTLVKDAGGYGINWGNDVAMCLPPVAFGGPTRLTTTLASGRGDIDTVYDVQNFAVNAMRAEVGMSHRQDGTHPVSFVVWGTVVTGSHNPVEELFDESIWCPGFDGAEVAPEITRLLAQAAEPFQGDTYIHPDCLSATAATEFATRLTKEQFIDWAINDVLLDTYSTQPSEARVRITKIIPEELPYMDQFILSVLGRANTVLASYRFSRSDLPLDEDVEYIAGLCRARGVTNFEVVDLKEPIHANEYPGYVVMANGEWMETIDARLGDMRSLVTQDRWGMRVGLAESYTLAAHRLPAVLFLEKCGVADYFAKHYTPEVFAEIKGALSSPCDPEHAVEEILRSHWRGTEPDFEWALREFRNALLTFREDLLALQFKLSQAALVTATPPLLGILSETDIGGDCPSAFLRSGFDGLYLMLRVPAQAIDDATDTASRRYIDGLYVQRWNIGDQEHLLLDIFVTSGSDVQNPDTVEDAIPLRLVLDEGSTLSDLRKQIAEDDGLGHQALDLFAGVTLYMNSRGARVQQRDDLIQATDALKQLNRKKRKPADYNRVQSSFNAIYVGPESAQDVQSGLSGHTYAQTSKAPHYRRGFVRYGQRVGKGLTETRPVFIPPVLVNAHKMLQGQPVKKPYVVGPRK